MSSFMERKVGLMLLKSWANWINGGHIYHDKHIRPTGNIQDDIKKKTETNMNDDLHPII